MVVPNCLMGDRKPFYRLYTIAEKGWENDGGTDNEKTSPDQRYDGLDNILISSVPLNVNLERGHDNTERGDGIADV